MMLPESCTSRIRRLQDALNTHPVYQAVEDLDDLRSFMEHHIYSVWDFMSLLKSLQHELAPSRQPWAPGGNTAARRFINEIVLEEESDEGPAGPGGQPTYMSHFELYAKAMIEIGAEPRPAMRLAELAAELGFDQAIEKATEVPGAAAAFMQSTFSVIATGKPHAVGAAFAFGREQVIPEMFRALLARMGVLESQAPTFHYYLERHIHLDEGQHGPLAMLMLDNLIGKNAAREKEAEQAALEAIEARIAFWDGVLEAIRANRVGHRRTS